MSQQQTSLWNALPTAVLNQVISNSTNPTFVKPSPTILDKPVDNATILPGATSTQRQYSQKMKDLELWHQRLGHCGTSTMNETRKCTEGIPAFPTTNPFFRCPFCEKAKMLK